MSFERAMVSRILTRLGLGGGVSAAHVASEHLAYRERKTKTKGPKRDMKEFLRQQGATTVMSPLTRQKIKITSLTGGKYRDDPKSQELLKKMFQAWKGKAQPEAAPEREGPEPSGDEEVPEGSEAAPAEEDVPDGDTPAEDPVDGQEPPKSGLPTPAKAPAPAAPPAPPAGAEPVAPAGKATPAPAEQPKPSPPTEGEAPAPSGRVEPPEPGLSRAPEVPESIRDLANPAEGAESTVVNDVIRDAVAGRRVSQEDAWKALKQSIRALGRSVDANGKPTISAEDLKKLQDSEEWLRSLAGMELDEPELDLDKGQKGEERELSEDAKAVVTKHGLTPKHVDRMKKFVKKKEKDEAEAVKGTPAEKLRLQWGLTSDDVNTARRSWSPALTRANKARRKYEFDLKGYEESRPALEEAYEEAQVAHSPKMTKYEHDLPATKEKFKKMDEEIMARYEEAKKEYDEGVARGEEGLDNPPKPTPTVIPGPPAPPKKPPEPPKEPEGVDVAEVRRDIEDGDPDVARALSEMSEEDMRVLLQPKDKSKSVGEIKKQYIDSLTDPDEKKRISDMDPNDFDELLSALRTSRRGRGKWGTLREQVVRVAYLHPKMRGRLLSALSPYYGGWV